MARNSLLTSGQIGDAVPQRSEPSRRKSTLLAQAFEPGQEFYKERLEAESRYPFLKNFRDVPIGRAKEESKGGLGEFVEPNHPSNPFPGKYAITIGKNSKNLKGGVADTIIADMVHAASTLNPKFRGLKSKMVQNLSEEEKSFAKRKYETEFKGKFTGSNFSNFDNFMNNYWSDGIIQHLLLPEKSEINQIKQISPNAAPYLDQIQKLFRGQ